MGKQNTTDDALLGTTQNTTPDPKTQQPAPTPDTDVGNPTTQGGAGEPGFEGTGDANTQQSNPNQQTGEGSVSSEELRDQILEQQIADYIAENYTSVNTENNTTVSTTDIRAKVKFDYEINANHFNVGDQVTVNFVPENQTYNSSDILLTVEDKQQLLDLGYDINFDYTYSDITYGNDTFKDVVVPTVNKPDPISQQIKPCQTGFKPSTELSFELASLLENNSINEMTDKDYLNLKILDGSVDIFRDINWTPGYDMLGYVLDRWNEITDFVNQPYNIENVEVLLSQINDGFKVESRGIPGPDFHQTQTQYQSRAINQPAENNNALETVRSSSYNIDSIKFYLMLVIDEDSPINKLIRQAGNIPVDSTDENPSTYADIMITANQNTNHDIYQYYLEKVGATNLSLPQKYPTESVGIRAYWDVLNLFTGQHITIGTELLMAPYYCETTSPHEIFMRRLEQSGVGTVDEEDNLFGSVTLKEDINNIYGLKRYGSDFNSDLSVGPSFKLLLASPKIWEPTENPYNNTSLDAYDYIDGKEDDRLHKWLTETYIPGEVPVSYVDKSAANDSGWADQLSEIDRDTLGGFESDIDFFFRTADGYNLGTPSNQKFYDVDSTVTNQTYSVYPDNLIDNLLFPSDFYFIRQHPGYEKSNQDGPMFVPTINGGAIHYGTNYIEKDKLYNLGESTYGTEILPFQEVKPFVKNEDLGTQENINRDNNNIEFPLPGVVGISSSTMVPGFHKKINFEYAVDDSHSSELNNMASQHGWVVKSSDRRANVKLSNHNKEFNAYETINDAWQVIWQHYLNNYDDSNLSFDITLNGNVIPDVIINENGFEFPYAEPGLLQFKVTETIIVDTEQIELVLLENEMELTTNSINFELNDIPLISADSISKDFAVNLYGGSFRFKMAANIDQQNSTDENDPFFQRTIPNLLNDHISHGFVPSVLEYPINVDWMTEGGTDFNYDNISRNCVVKVRPESSFEGNDYDGSLLYFYGLSNPTEVGYYSEMPMLLDPIRFNNTILPDKTNPSVTISPREFFDGSTDGTLNIHHRVITTHEHLSASPRKRQYFVVLYNTDFIPEEGEQYTFSSKIRLREGFKVVGGVRRARTVDDTFDLYNFSSPPDIEGSNSNLNGPLRDSSLKPSEVTPFRLSGRGVSSVNYRHNSRLSNDFRRWKEEKFLKRHFLENSAHFAAHRHIKDHVEHFNLWNANINDIYPELPDHPIGLDEEFTNEQYLDFVNRIIEDNLITPSKVVDGTLLSGDDFSPTTPPSDFIYFTYKHSNKAVVNDVGSYYKKENFNRYLAGGLQLAFVIYRDVENYGRQVPFGDGDQLPNYNPMWFDIIEPKLSTQDQYRNQPDVARIGPTVFSDQAGYNTNFGGWLPQEGVQADYGVRYTFRVRRHPEGEQQQNLKTYGTYGDITTQPLNESVWRSPNRTSTKGVKNFSEKGVDYTFEENSDEYILQTTIVDTYQNLYLINEPFTVTNIVKALKSVQGQYSPFQGIDISDSLVPQVPYTTDWENFNDDDKRPNLGVYYYADDWTEDIGELLAGSLENFAVTEENEDGTVRAVDNVFTQSAASLLEEVIDLESNVTTYMNCRGFQANGNEIEGFISTDPAVVDVILQEANEQVELGLGDNIADIYFPPFTLGQGCKQNAPSYCQTVDSYITYYQTNNTTPAWSVVNSEWYNQVQQPDNQCRNAPGYPAGQRGLVGNLTFGGSEYTTNWVPDVDIRPTENLANGTINATLFNYYDRELQPTRFELTSAPTTIAMLVYKRQSAGLHDQQTAIPFNALEDYIEFDDNFPTYIINIDWGDGTSDPDQNYTNEPLLLTKNTVLTHTYTKPGVHTVKFLMMDTVKNTDSIVSSNFPNNAILGFINYWYVTVRFNLSENPENESVYIVNQKPTVTISGVSKDSVYAKSLRNFIGYAEGSDSFQGFPLQFQYDTLHTNVAASTVDELYYNKDIINPWTGSVTDRRTGELIHNGSYTNLNSLGDYIGDSDIASVRIYNKPKRIWSQLGFETSRQSDVGQPTNFYYWKNIIPKDFNTYDRQGVTVGENTITIEPDSNQNWIGGYAYPSLPKVDEAGQFDLEKGYQNDTIFYGAKTAWDSYDVSASISNQYVRDENLVIDLEFSEIDDNSLRDASGNLNKGTLVADYKLNYDRNTNSITRNDNLFIPNRGTQNDGPY